MSEQSKRFVVFMILMALSGCHLSVEEICMPHPHIDINAEESTGDDGARQLIFRSEELSSKDAVSIIQPLFKAHAVLIQIDALILGAIEKVVGQEEEVETTPYRTYGGVI